MIKNYAVLYNNVVENLISSELPVEEIELLPQRQLVELSPEHELGSGYTYEGANFIAPSRTHAPGMINDVDVTSLLSSLLSIIDESTRNKLLQQLNLNIQPDQQMVIEQILSVANT